MENLNTLLEYLKTREFQFTDSSTLTKIEFEGDPYNPFDVNFSGRIYGDNGLLIELSNEDKLVKVRVGRNNGWIGGLSYTSCEEIFSVPRCNVASIIEGFKSNVQEYTLCSMYSSDVVNEQLFKGSLVNLIAFAENLGLTKHVSQTPRGNFKDTYFYDDKKHKTYHTILAL